MTSEFIQGMQSLSLKVNQYNLLYKKEENHKIISIDAKITLDKILCNKIS